MSAPLSPEIRVLLARCMSQIELEWGAPDAELRAVLGVPLDAPIGTKPNEARAAGGLLPVREFDAPCVADLVESFEEVNVRNHQAGGRKSAIIRHPWQACAACGPWRHFDARAIAATPEDVATLFSPAESMDFEEAHIVVGDRCVPWVLTPGQVAQLLAAGGRPC